MSFRRVNPEKFFGGIDMLFQGIFTSSEDKNEYYNRMRCQVDNASFVDAELAAKMRAKFRELRRVNREWDGLRDELAESVANALARPGESQPS